MAFTDEGDELPYDALVVATGAEMPPPGADPDLRDRRSRKPKDLLLDLEEDYDDAAAFVVSPGPSWPLPVYELALLTMAEVRGRNARHASYLAGDGQEELLDLGPDSGKVDVDMPLQTHPLGVSD